MSPIYSKRLAKIRKMMQMNRDDFAGLMGMSSSMLSFVENGTRPTILTYVKLAEYLYADYLKAHPAPSDMPDVSLKSKVFVLDSQGKSREDICRELALRPEVVGYLLDSAE